MPHFVPPASPTSAPSFVGKTQQVKGREYEGPIIEGRGGRQHSNSGAGTKKGDGSSDTEVIEVKLAAKSYTVTGKYLAQLLKQAAPQGKDAVLVIYFEDQDITLSGTIARGRH